MREILFRGKPKREDDYYFFSQTWKDNCKDGFAYGFLVISKDHRYYICVSALCSIKSCVNNGMTSMIEVIPESVEEYTTLTDKNGKKIFEGDIVECWSEGVKAKGTVQKRRDGWWFIYPAWQKNIIWGLCPNEDGSTSVEVIGNIHDNPELLKEMG